MGLIKAATSAIGSTMHDQWKEYIKCDDLGDDILMKRVTTPNGVISKNSAIQVGPSQLAVILQNGQILDATAEQGIYTFDQSTSPTFFAGDFGEVFKEMWARFTYNGATNKEQSVFYFNIKQITGNNYGTPNPVPFQDWSHAIPNQMTGTLSPMRLEIRSFGKYIFKITDPVLFMNEFAGVKDIVKKDELIEQMRSEVLESFQNVLNELGTSKYKAPVLELPSYTDEIKEIMKGTDFNQPSKDRGVNIIGFTIESVTLTDESNKKIDNYEVSSNSFMQQGSLVGAYSNAVQDAANNANGAANGFMGIGMMNMASGGMVGGSAMNPFNGQNTNNSFMQTEDPYAKKSEQDVEGKESEDVEVPQEEGTNETVSEPVENVNVEENIEPTVQEEVVNEKNNESITDDSSNENASNEASKTFNNKFCPNCGTPVTGKFCSNCGQQQV